MTYDPTIDINGFYFTPESVDMISDMKANLVDRIKGDQSYVALLDSYLNEAKSGAKAASDGLIQAFIDYCVDNPNRVNRKIIVAALLEQRSRGVKGETP